MTSEPRKLPARYRPTLWARLIDLTWTVVLFLLRPVGVLFRALGNLRRYDG